MCMHRWLTGIGMVFLVAWLGLGLSDFLPVDFFSGSEQAPGEGQPHYRIVPVDNPVWVDHLDVWLLAAGGACVLAGLLARRKAR